jgi:Ser/Thr protein kinase RdoA (MazF antagonist)
MGRVFPTIYSTLSPDALAAEVLPDYDIGAASCRLYLVNVSDTYVVKADGGDTYFFRVYRKSHRTRSEVCFELDMLNHLHCKGVPVSWPLPRRNGSLIHELAAPEGTRYGVLFSAALGQEPSYDDDPEEMASRYGQAVARMHNALDDFASEHTRFQIDLEHLIDGPLRRIQPLLARRPDDWTYVRDFAATVRRRISDAPHGALERGACHGDLQSLHAHLDDDGTMTFYDFDFCGVGYRAYDLAVFPWAARLNDKESIWWPPYLRGYRQERPLNDLDVEFVPIFICARHIWHMGLHAREAEGWGHGGMGDAYFDRRLDWLRALEADYLS